MKKITSNENLLPRKKYPHKSALNDPCQRIVPRNKGTPEEIRRRRRIQSPIKRIRWGFCRKGVLYKNNRGL